MVAAAPVQGAPNANTLGRLAGVAYAAIILFSIAGYTTTTRLLAGETQLVVERLAENHTQLVLGWLAMAIGFVAWIAVGLLLYRLMSVAGRTAGVLLLVFVAGGVAMSFVALSQLLPLVGSGSSLNVATVAPVVASYNRALLLAQLFSGLWLFPFGWLVVRSRVAPAFLGYCLLVGGFGYVTVFATAFDASLGDALAFRVVSAVFGIPAMIGEFGICLWLLIKGAREPQPARVA